MLTTILAANDGSALVSKFKEFMDNPSMGGNLMKILTLIAVGLIFFAIFKMVKAAASGGGGIGSSFKAGVPTMISAILLATLDVWFIKLLEALVKIINAVYGMLPTF